MKVYHWTSKANKERILNDGLRQWSFVCRSRSDWHGEVCLEIDLPYDIDWDNRDEHAKWQSIVPETIVPSRIRIC